MVLTTPKFGPIGQDVYERTYSRVRDDGRNETWSDTVDRVVTGNFELAPDHVSVAEHVRLSGLMEDFKLIPAGRHLWVTGVPGIPGEAKRNCYVAPWGDSLAEHFEFTGSMLLLGGGVGSNYSTDILDRYPKLQAFKVDVIIHPEHKDADVVPTTAGYFEPVFNYNSYIIVDDSREGWVVAWGALFEAATKGLKLVLDLSDVRPAGSVIKTFGGTASGPAALAQSLIDIAASLNRCVERGGYFNGLDAMECDHAIASAVVAGGTRRSARMSMMHWNDPLIFEFINCKSHQLLHWTTNISIEIDNEFIQALGDINHGDHLHARNVYDTAMVGMSKNGEPGFANTEKGSVGERERTRATNPCGENFLQGGESCNIGSVNLDEIGTDDSLAEDAFRYMTRFLLRQTLSPMTIEPTRTIEAENRRIGVGFLGLQGWAAAHGVRYSDIPKSKVLRDKLVRFRQIIRQEADAYSAKLGINSPIKVTAIAPNGTIAQLPGTQPGGHSILMRQGIRNVRYTTGHVKIAEALAAGYLVEPCIYSANTQVVSYPLVDPLMARFADPGLIQSVQDVSLFDQLAVLQFVTETFCSGTDGNAVSYTASFDPLTVTPEEIDEAVMHWLPHVKGLTVFPTLSRDQAPYIPLTEDQFAQMFPDYNLAVGDTGEEELACSVSGGCPIR